MRYNSIDALKGFAIISVLLLHTLPQQLLYDVYAKFHVWQTMPIFMILMGVTSGMSINKTFDLKQHAKTKFHRIILPFFVLFMVSLLYGIYLGEMYIGYGNLIGILPVSGSGNYFITFILQFILIVPLILYAYNNHPQHTILTMFLINIVFEFVFSNYNHTYLYSASIFKWFADIAVGLYISTYLINNKPIPISTPIKLWFLIGFIYLMFETKDFQSVLSLGYPLMFIIISIKYNLSNKWLEHIGKYSYEIFLAQIMIFR